MMKKKHLTPILIISFLLCIGIYQIPPSSHLLKREPSQFFNISQGIKIASYPYRCARNLMILLKTRKELPKRASKKDPISKLKFYWEKKKYQNFFQLLNTHNNQIKSPKNIPLYSKRLLNLMKLSNNNILPGYFQHYEDETYQTLKIMEYFESLTKSNLDQERVVVNEELESAYKNIINEYTNYHSILESKSLDVFNLKIQTNALKEFFNTSKSQDFPAEVPIQVLIKKNDQYTLKKEILSFQSNLTLKENIRLNDIRLKKSILTSKEQFQNLFKRLPFYEKDNLLNEEEIITSGGTELVFIKEIFMQQAAHHRRLIFILSKLETVPTLLQSPKQKKIITKISNLINDKKLIPEINSYIQQVLLESNYEGRIYRSSKKTKRSIELNYIEETLEHSNRLMKRFQNVLIALAGIGLIYNITPNHFFYNVLFNHKIGEHFLYIKAKIFNEYNWLIYNIKKGRTRSLIECAREGREFIVEIGCIKTLFLDHFSSNIYKTNILDSYNFLEDKEIMDKSRKFIKNFITLRKQEFQDEKIINTLISNYAQERNLFIEEQELKNKSPLQFEIKKSIEFLALLSNHPSIDPKLKEQFLETHDALTKLNKEIKSNDHLNKLYFEIILNTIKSLPKD